MKIRFCYAIILATILISCESHTAIPTEPEATSTVNIVPALSPTIPTPSPITYTPTILIQDDNYSQQTQITAKSAQHLENNYIGNEGGGFENGGYGIPEYTIDPGFKWIRISANTDFLNWQRATITQGSFYVPSEVESVIRYYGNNGVTILLNLGVGDGQNRPDLTRFKNEEEIERYLDYVRFIVAYFKGRIKYYEIWNEPNVPASDSPWGQIAFEDYIRLLKRVAPVIREVDPDAKIVVGAVSGVWRSGYPGYGEWARHNLDINYLEALASSDVMPLVDGISWHPFYCTRADDSYYQAYPQMVDEIKQIAWEHGFRGIFITEEISWRTPDVDSNTDLQPFDELIVTKYLIRSVVVHRGLDVMVGISMGESTSSRGVPSRDQAIATLNTIMAGAMPTNEQLKVQVESESSLDTENYSFFFPGDNKMIAIWTDGLPVENAIGEKFNIILKDITAKKITAIDVLYGVQQQLNWQQVNHDIHIFNIRIRDYPLFIIFSN